MREAMGPAVAYGPHGTGGIVGRARVGKTTPLLEIRNSVHSMCLIRIPDVTLYVTLSASRGSASRSSKVHRPQRDPENVGVRVGELWNVSARLHLSV